LYRKVEVAVVTLSVATRA